VTAFFLIPIYWPRIGWCQWATA